MYLEEKMGTLSLLVFLANLTQEKSNLSFSLGWLGAEARLRRNIVNVYLGNLYILVIPKYFYNPYYPLRIYLK
jgi:hypothetical protein